MGLLDHYRRFEDVDEAELNAERRRRRAAERRLALERPPELDLSSTGWPELPHSEIANAAIHRARGWLNDYPDRRALRVRRLLAERHSVDPGRVALGNGAAELLQAAALALLAPGDELLTAWPSYPLYPLMARRARARPVPVERGGLAEAVGERTRLVVICNPNDPTGDYMPAAELDRLLAGLPERVHVVVDEALVHFQDIEPEDACLRLTDAHARLLVVRSFSKAYGLAGVRAGYAVAAAGCNGLLEAIVPALGVNALTQAAVEQALLVAGPDLERRRRLVVRERGELAERLRRLGLEVGESQANFLWLRAPGTSGAALAAALGRQGVIVAPGGPLGAHEHVRAAVHGRAASDRLVRALERPVA